MPLTFNRNTTQKPMSALGLTGKQLVKFIPASRVYVKPTDSQDAAPVQNYYSISNGVTPTGWIDLGTLTDSGVKVTFDAKVNQVLTGPTKALRAAYLSGQGATASFGLSQFDDVALSTITGITPTILNQGSTVSYTIGSDDMMELAVLLVVQDLLTGKEIQLYNPSAFISFAFGYESDNSLSLTCQAVLPYFTPSGATSECFLYATEYAASQQQSVGPIADSFSTSFAGAVSVILPFNLSTTDVVPFVTDQYGNPMEYSDFRVIDANNALLTFSVPVTGSILIRVMPNQVAQDFTCAPAGDEFSATIVHNLGTTNIGLCVYQNGLVIQTGNVTTFDANTIGIMFSTNVTGRAIIYPLS